MKIIMRIMKQRATPSDNLTRMGSGKIRGREI
jgi:hypothetical protein